LALLALPADDPPPGLAFVWVTLLPAGLLGVGCCLRRMTTVGLSPVVVGAVAGVEAGGALVGAGDEDVEEVVVEGVVDVLVVDEPAPVVDAPGSGVVVVVGFRAEGAAGERSTEGGRREPAAGQHGQHRPPRRTMRAQAAQATHRRPFRGCSSYGAMFIADRRSASLTHDRGARHRDSYRQRSKIP
jgi:hypothetical protein